MGRRVGSTARAEKGGWGNAVDAFEGAGELKRIEAEVGGDFTDQPSGGVETLGGPLHLEALEIAVGRLALEPLEEAAEVGSVDVTGGGGLPKRWQCKEVLLDVGPAAFEGGHRAAGGR